MATPGIPFAWHFKEGLFICLEMETWPQLIDLYQKMHGLSECWDFVRAVANIFLA
ncbi:hypothetical protein SAMN05720354_12626 [Nitrosospira sp. Nsp1]|nr:hypothetical protein SAMN05720354_12626 [Nitrosospira sp. Nsp1]